MSTIITIIVFAMTLTSFSRGFDAYSETVKIMYIKMKIEGNNKYKWQIKKQVHNFSVVVSVERCCR